MTDAETAAALLRSLGWSVVAPVADALPNIGEDERARLLDVAHALRCGWTCYQIESPSIRNLAAHGLVEPHPDYADAGGLPAWRITRNGLAVALGARP